MTAVRGTIEIILGEIAEALARLQESLQPQNFAELLFELGIDDPPDLSGDSVFVLKTDAAADTVSALVSKEEELDAAIDEEDTSRVLKVSAALLGLIKSVGDSLDAVAADLPRAAFGSAAEDAIIALSSEFTQRTIALAIARHIDVAHPVLERALRVLGVIERTIEVVPLDASAPARVRRRLVFGRMPRLFSNPMSVLLDAYRWGATDFRAKALLRNIADLFSLVGPAVSGLGDEGLGGEIPDDNTDVPALIDFLTLTVGASEDAIPGLEAALFVDVGTNQRIELGQFGKTGRVVLSVGGGYKEGVAAKLLPPLTLEITPPPGGVVDGHLGVELIATAPDGKRIELFSIASSCTLDATVVSAGLFADLAFSGTSAKADFGLRAGIQHGRLQVIPDTENGDGFLERVIPANSLVVEFEFGLRWTPSGGLQVEGHAGLETSIPIDKTIGPLSVQTLSLLVSASSQGLALNAGVAVAVSLGPVAVTIQGIGLGVALDFDTRGSLGGADLDVAFKPPTGVGIAINAGPISGGGFISHEGDRYSGVLELSIYSIAVKAFGIIDTKMPDGTKGYSFVIVISAEFQPIQLGLGFTLNGVGGVLGINRTLSQDALAKAFEGKGIEDLLFPKDVVKNAPEIIANLATVFPAAEDKQVFGPMAKLGWGTPNLVTGDLALILSLPEKVITILGLVSVQLPAKKEEDSRALVDLHLAVKGLLDFPQGLFSLEASLTKDSTVGGYPVGGQMATIVRWGSRPNFLFSMGGYNSAFKPPADFPALRRVSIDLGIKGNPNITVAGYFAVTSNSVQVGGELDVHATGYGITLDAFLKTETIFIFSPFSFDATIDAGVHVDFIGIGFTVSLHGHLSGPSPWHIDAKVCASVWFASACLPVSITLTSPPSESLPSLDPWVGSLEVAPKPQSVIGLKNALEDARNWTPGPGNNTLSVVSLAEPPRRNAGEPSTVVDPLDAIIVRQRVVPLETKGDAPIVRFGPVKSSGDPTFTLLSATIGTSAEPLSVDNASITDYFAPAQYFDVSDTKVMSAPSFDRYVAGYKFDVAAESLFGSTEAQDSLEFDTYIIDSKQPTLQPDIKFGVANDVYRGLRKVGPAALAGIARKGANTFFDFSKARTFLFQDPRYVVSRKSSAQVMGVFDTPATRIEALVALDRHLQAHPEDRQTLQVSRVVPDGGP